MSLESQRQSVISMNEIIAQNRDHGVIYSVSEDEEEKEEIPRGI